MMEAPVGKLLVEEREKSAGREVGKKIMSELEPPKYENEAIQVQRVLLD